MKEVQRIKFQPKQSENSAVFLTEHHSEGIQLTGTYHVGVHTQTCKVQGNGNKPYNWQDSLLKLPFPGQAEFADGWLSQGGLQVLGENVKVLVFAFFKVQILRQLKILSQFHISAIDT